MPIEKQGMNVEGNLIQNNKHWNTRIGLRLVPRAGDGLYVYTCMSELNANPKNLESQVIDAKSKMIVDDGSTAERWRNSQVWYEMFRQGLYWAWPDS